MRVQRLAAPFFAALMLLAGGAVVPTLCAQESAPSRTLVPGKGAELTMARCAICHDITHVTRAKLSRGEWQDNVRNMVERGMPIAPDEIPIIVEYLATYYNRDSDAPAPDASAAPARDPLQQLLADYACIGCHAVEQKIVGPSFREVATRYAGDAGAGPRLAAKIKAGGAGAWGSVPMPAHPALSDPELALLASWILGRK
jgi:sulfite dehydrogenase